MLRTLEDFGTLSNFSVRPNVEPPQISEAQGGNDGNGGNVFPLFCVCWFLTKLYPRRLEIIPAIPAIPPHTPRGNTLRLFH